ncbi:MAG TPA: Gfo/Idh/MocA family oxidoreductase [Arachnia sp.]|nr:Gfo/Idh/MocA family oxidoreductase [Arachnia sp.]
MSDNDIRWGILATGGIAQTLAGDMAVSGITVAAVASRTAESAQAFADRFGIPTAHGGYQALAEDPTVDVVYIATPHPMHAEWALAMIDAGKHVLVEKAFTMNRAEAEQIRDRARAKDVLVMEAMWTRYLPHMARIREIIAAGTLGELRGLIADHSQRLPSDPAHRINAPELGGGALLDLTIYPISFAFDLFGTPQTVLAQAVMGETGVDVVDAISFGYGTGALASISATSQAAGPNTAVILGTEARIEIDRVWYTPTSFRVVSHDGTVLETYRSDVPGTGRQLQMLAFEEYLAEGRRDSDLLGLDESVEIMGTLDEIRRQIGLVF